ncbi:MAG: CopD family protein [Candidatus Rokubacteria bacterium]|nr:CopD family protein [Candidatus Rokubacteria bacterium]
MISLGIALRWAHLAVSVCLVGAAGVLLLAGRSDRATAVAWEARVVRATQALALGAMTTGLAALAYQVAVLEGHAAAVLDPLAWRRVLLETQAGNVWLARLGLLTLLAAFVGIRWDVARSVDWTAARAESVALGVAALALIAGAGHAAAVEPGAAGAMLVDALHLFAAGLWIGGLLPLALLARAAAGEDGADARPYAVLAARRFSRAALLLVLVLLITGAGNALTHVGNVAGLVGTPYGRLLLTKLGLLAPILALGAWHRGRVLPRLHGEAAREGRPALRRLAAGVGVEAALALALLAVVAAMGSTPPARHEQPVWPFGFRLSVALLEGPALARVLVGSQLGVLGVVAVLATLFWRERRAPLVAGAVVLVGFGVGLALPPLALDAYPTTYVRPVVPYSATSIHHGLALYRERCVACHGSRGAGDGPAGGALPRPPADLRSPHTGQHTAGDLFWWISGGIPRAGMPGAGALDEDDRWDLVNVVRHLGAAEAAKRLGPAIEPERPWLPAPDFAFAVGPTPSRTLRDYRGRRHVLLVLYDLPASRARLRQLAEAYQAVAVAGGEIIAVPRDAAPDALRRLDVGALVLYPVVTEGAAAIVETYGMLAPRGHAELLIDRQGYVRARAVGPASPASVDGLLTALAALGAERTVAPPADEHVH